MQATSGAKVRSIKRRDRIARWVITLGGVLVIGSVIAIVLLIAGVTIPLFRPARATEFAQLSLPAGVQSDDVMSVGVEWNVGKHGRAAYLLTGDGAVTFVDLESGQLLSRQELPRPSGAQDLRVAAVERHAGTRFSLFWSDGSSSLVEITRTAKFDQEGDRSTEYGAKILASEPSDGETAKQTLLRSTGESDLSLVRLTSDGRLKLTRKVAKKNLLDEIQVKSRQVALDTDGLSPITAIAMDSAGRTLYAGTQSGQLARWQIAEDGEVPWREVVEAFDDGRTVTSLAMLLGDFSLIVGDSQGQVTTWFPVRDGGGTRLAKAHSLAPHPSAVREVLPSMRNKSVLSVGEEGTIHLDYTTSERHLLSLESQEPSRLVGIAPRGEAVVGLDSAGQLAAWQIDSPHPEISWKTLFGKVLYEGYDEPNFKWETSGAEDAEAKYSLVPLFFGTLKGTFYAMFFAMPLALFGAIYTAHFTTPGFRQSIKPAVEIMAAVPSVVIGFLVGLWLADKMERWAVAFFVSTLTVPAVFLAFMLFWQSVRRFDWTKRFEGGYEFLVLVPVLMIGVAIACVLMAPVETLLFGGDFKMWLSQTLGTTFEQKNSVIIAFGLGFAVIPIIFSIAEDALSSVPYNFTAASLALGASRWQTLRRVILPSASPGIFAGIMIGFGRAVGETMIVLMATGNTPILDWSPFNGMRTMSATIAEEMPETVAGSTHYRVLFLCAVLLFALTFLLNTSAELVRQRLRKRYGRY